MNPYEMVIGILLIVTIGNVLRAVYGAPRGAKGRKDTDHSVRDDAAASVENHRLKAEIAQMKERIQVLERVVTDTDGSVRLDREIEKLRAPNRD